MAVIGGAASPSGGPGPSARATEHMPRAERPGLCLFHITATPRARGSSISAFGCCTRSITRAIRAFRERRDSIPALAMRTGPRRSRLVPTQRPDARAHGRAATFAIQAREPPRPPGTLVELALIERAGVSLCALGSGVGSTRSRLCGRHRRRGAIL